MDAEDRLVQHLFAVEHYMAVQSRMLASLGRARLDLLQDRRLVPTKSSSSDGRVTLTYTSRGFTLNSTGTHDKRARHFLQALEHACELSRIDLSL